jgi:hypothetical protein
MESDELNGFERVCGWRAGVREWEMSDVWTKYMG